MFVCGALLTAKHDFAIATNFILSPSSLFLSIFYSSFNNTASSLADSSTGLESFTSVFVGDIGHFPEGFSANPTRPRLVWTDSRSSGTQNPS